MDTNTDSSFSGFSYPTIPRATYFYQQTPALRDVIYRPAVVRLGRLAIKTETQIKNILRQEIHIAQPRALAPKIRKIIPNSEHTMVLPAQNPLAMLRQTLARSNEVLATATTVFPMTLFRDDIVVDRTKVTITKRDFFFVKEVMSIRIEDILNVKVTIGPFFGSLTIAVRVLSSEDHHSINYFWRKDAIHLKHIIQGYIIAQHNNIDISTQSREELISTLTELGHDEK